MPEKSIVFEVRFERTRQRSLPQGGRAGLCVKHESTPDFDGSERQFS
jgi:hypothetical protein